MLRSLICTIAISFAFMSLSFSQSRNCETMNSLQQLQNNDPLLEQRMEAIERFTQDYIQNPGVQRSVVTIPVVFHIVYRTNTENISTAQIQSQLDVLNEDFRRLNSDRDNVWAQAADAEIEFCLATVDPNGNATNGITRTATNVNGFGTGDGVKFDSQGGKNAWDASKYMNFWVCNIGNGILGYAQFPGGPASTDGVVCDYRYTGTLGTATAPFNKGRTGTHEVGHYLNLYHIWGDGNCNQDDQVTDTPLSDASNGGCSLGHVSCGSVDMVQNYMDYSDDACMNLFTIGQKNRMQALFAPGGARYSLVNSTACGGSPPPPPPGCNATTVNFTLVLDQYPAETTWSIVNSNGTTVENGGPYNAPFTTVNLDFCLADGCYDFVINDSYGDGICCSYGNGSYTLLDGGTTLVSGGQFTQSETKNFCIGNGGPTPTCNDGQQNGDETGVDCGGSSCPACPTCNDGQQNGDETGVDCGGSSCPACPTCNDGQQNGDETGVDCGGNTCPACPTCNDGVQNGDETGVDCGGSCPACPTGCNGTEVRVALVLDNYPAETTWFIVNSNGITVQSGGSYSVPNSTVNVDVCLPEGCYDFIINDTYGDGICCSYGIGSYNVLDGGTVLASGGQFTNSEATNFCVGGGGPAPTCNDGQQNGDETGVDCGGSSCPACPTCNDGIQNGDETGVDCGGSTCPPCPTGGCTDIDSEGFETGWGIWNDGGTDCYRSSAYSNNGPYTIRLRDNSGNASAMTTDALSLAGNNEVTIAFSYYPVSMENGEDFFYEISTDNGASWFILQSWVRGVDFNNNQRQNVQVIATGTFTDQTKLRLRCDASGNSDWIYVDDVEIEACNSNGNRTNAINLADLTPVNQEERRPVTALSDNDFLSDLEIFPNPTAGLLNIRFEMSQPSGVEYSILDVSGRVIKYDVQNYDSGTQFIKFDGSDLVPGCYFLRLTNGDQHFVEKFIIAQ